MTNHPVVKFHLTASPECQIRREHIQDSCYTQISPFCPYADEPLRMCGTPIEYANKVRIFILRILELALGRHQPGCYSRSQIERQPGCISSVGNRSEAVFRIYRLLDVAGPLTVVAIIAPKKAHSSRKKAQCLRISQNAKDYRHHHGLRTVTSINPN